MQFKAIIEIPIKCLPSHVWVNGLFVYLGSAKGQSGTQKVKSTPADNISGGFVEFVSK